MPTADDGRAVANIERIATSLLATMDAVAGRLEKVVSASADRRAADEAVEPVAVAELEANSSLVGAGFVASAAQSGGEGRLSWWQSRLGAERVIARLDSGVTGAGDYQRDIDAVEWYYEPLAKGGPHLTGPYVDYLCTDDLTITYTIPVVVAGEVRGVVGCDVAARSFEAELDAGLARLEGPAVVVTDQGRIVASSDDDALVMRRLRDDREPGFRWRQLGRSPFRLGRR